MECIEGMNLIEDNSIDMILCDLPYGTTDCKWDSVIPFDQLWKQYNRIIKGNGAIVLTATQPFTTALIQSNRRMFKYCWYWIKNQPTGFPFAKYQPMRCVEEIAVFYKNLPRYTPQGLIKLDKPIKNKGKTIEGGIYRTGTLSKDTETYYTNYPRQTLDFKCERGLHPTQKPVALFEYLIKTYTNKGDVVLDNCIGSGTTAVACINTGRQFIGFEQEEKYYKTTLERIAKISKV